MAALSITVHDKFQNMGIGTVLLKHLLDIARGTKLRKVWVLVNTTNAVAVHLYKKAGFEIEGKRYNKKVVKGKYRDEYRNPIFL